MVCVPAVGDKWTARARVYGILSRQRGQHIPRSHFGQMTRSVRSWRELCPGFFAHPIRPTRLQAAQT